MIVGSLQAALTSVTDQTDNQRTQDKDCIDGTKSPPHSAELHQIAKWIEQDNILPYINKHLGGDNEKNGSMDNLYPIANAI